MAAYKCRCGETRVDFFYNNQPHKCRECHREWQAAWRQRKREMAPPKPVNKEPIERASTLPIGRNCREFLEMTFSSKESFRSFCQSRQSITDKSRWASKIAVPSCCDCPHKRRVGRGFIPSNAIIKEMI